MKKIFLIIALMMITGCGEKKEIIINIDEYTEEKIKVLPYAYIDLYVKGALRWYEAKNAIKYWLKARYLEKPSEFNESGESDNKEQPQKEVKEEWRIRLEKIAEDL